MIVCFTKTRWEVRRERRDREIERDGGGVGVLWREERGLVEWDEGGGDDDGDCDGDCGVVGASEGGMVLLVG